ncbi:IS110 family transposase [Parvicella tangerina]|uniref:IS110 family transposase ISCARN67 n=1 Tax=Parvicella tangerina TaxID=2829795 RepID=A0A916NGP0_9FLAO|nr:IS110 family transposase [Parvicella tangerina]CAG5080086.1 IS110 family transposase ISCARN67 [Parvicella tangerina]CAG5080948.1 IS110 family transposase ISCARN67 [Parvicella tangerina]CAG5082399.1 IS110 family transposase ISCARN67 [Parvicella tangerina]
MELKVLKQALGLDVSKDTLSICLGFLRSDLTKEFVSRKDVANNKEGFSELVKWLKRTMKQDQLIVVMEATGVYHEGVSHYLHDLGYNVCIMQSGRVKKYAQSLNQRSKTDALDSKMLSMLGCERELQIWSPPSETLQELKSLSRERSMLVKERSVEKNRLEALKVGVHTESRTIKRFEKRLKLINTQIAEIEEEMGRCVQKDAELSRKINYLESIPGVSFISATTVVAETGGFALINNRKQLTSYAGYDVVLRDSGSFHGKTKISKKGNKHIRAVLHMPSMTAVRLNPTLKPFYQRLKPKKEKPIVALVAVQRKMLLLMYTLWKNEQYYDPEFEQKKAAKNQVFAAQDRNKPKFVTS